MASKGQDRRFSVAAVTNVAVLENIPENQVHQYGGRDVNCPQTAIIKVTIDSLPTLLDLL